MEALFGYTTILLCIHKSAVVVYTSLAICVYIACCFVYTCKRVLATQRRWVCIHKSAVVVYTSLVIRVYIACFSVYTCKLVLATQRRWVCIHKSAVVAYTTGLQFVYTSRVFLCIHAGAFWLHSEGGCVYTKVSSRRTQRAAFCVYIDFCCSVYMNTTSRVHSEDAVVYTWRLLCGWGNT